MNLEEFYHSIGGNYQNVLIYLPSSTLIIKYIKKFLDDNSFDLLEKNLKEKNYKEAFLACHTLKGICSNLGFGSLLKSSSILVEELRDCNNINIINVNNYFELVKDNYILLVNKINELINN